MLFAVAPLHSTRTSPLQPHTPRRSSTLRNKHNKGLRTASSVGLLEAFWRMIRGSPCLRRPAPSQRPVVTCLVGLGKIPYGHLLENDRWFTVPAPPRCPANVQLSLVSLLSARPKSPRCQALNMLENKRHARTSFETFWRIKMQIYYKKQKNSSNPSIFLVWRLLWRMQKEGISQEFKYVQI